MNILFFQCVAVMLICLIAVISLKLKSEVYIKVDIPHKIRRSAYNIIIINKAIIIILGILLYMSLLW
ncbi:hypothetical protein SAMN02745163_00290 [Clostridium cavendishii DSM 21758]|uniref:Uncharacterized protein n=1 Tax=Clostridium cavendishii DSM 21758 TaxID=1121302 RepID=A0A1M6BA24_9CLOT|nr:hypothetical protein [Clostridium cavendishii]SHI45323.1 hypothetical protein SAMN02745163_00290 [Clostridium cavendishii DSM 21758]